MARLVERTEIWQGYEAGIRFRISAEQYTRIAAYDRKYELPRGDE